MAAFVQIEGVTSTINRFFTLLDGMKRLDEQIAPLHPHSQGFLTPNQLLVLAILMDSPIEQRTKAMVSASVRATLLHLPLKVRSLRHTAAVRQVLRTLQRKCLITTRRSRGNWPSIHNPTRAVVKILRRHLENTESHRERLSSRDGSVLEHGH